MKPLFGPSRSMRAAIRRLGVEITLQRVTGYAPNVVVSASACLKAIVRDALPDRTQETQAGLPASEPGTVTQDDRNVIAMASDLEDSGFPLPLAKGDLVILPTGPEQYQLTRVDGLKRAAVGAVEFVITGVS